MRYDALAPVYDKVMNHVEYNAWAALITRIISRYSSVKHPAIFELGGGTGTLGNLLIHEGHFYQGSDYSFSMCREAQKKGLPFFCADCRSIPVSKKFDLIIFLYDGINYLQTMQDYENLFLGVHHSLAPNGLFLFDITTETNSLRYFIDYLDFDDFGDYSLIRHSHYDENETLQYNDFTIFKRENSCSQVYRKFTEQHVQKILPAKLIEEHIPKSLFRILGIWDDFSFRRYSSRSERIHFLLRKN